MSTTYRVRFWKIAHWKRKARPWGVRWVTEDKQHSEWFLTRALADARRSELMQAARAGDAFDVETGWPVGELRRRTAMTLVELAQSYVGAKWPAAAANTRRSTVEALATACASFTSAGAGSPSVRQLRRVLMRHLLPPPARDGHLASEDRDAVAWLLRHSRPVTDLSELSAARELLDGLTRNLDGSTAAATVIGRKRAVVHNMLAYAVERGVLTSNPLPAVNWKRPKRVEQVDPRVVVNPRQARELLTAVSYVGARNQDRGAHLVALFGTIYYSAARPAEVVNLRLSDCTLPNAGWGELILWESRPVAGQAVDRFR